MIFAILLIPSLLASWFCYWFSSVFPSLSNRTGKIICIACPLVLAILLAAIFITTPGVPGTVFEISDHPRWVVGGLLIAIAATLVIPTLLLAFAAAKFSVKSGSSGSHPA
jgi:hypothetical protein